MTNTQRMSIFAFFVAFSISCHANPATDSDSKTKNAFKQIEAKYSEGYCESIAKNPGFNSVVNRYFALLAMEDVSTFITGGDSLTGRWIGNIHTFQIGRKLNKNFVAFVTYANRKDVLSIVIKDQQELSKAIADETNLTKESFADLAKEVKDIKKSSMMPLATRTKEEAEREIERISMYPLYCHIYKIAMDEQSEPAIEFQKYINSVHQRASYKNIEKFEQSLENLESYN